MMHIVLVEPEIPPNTGNVIRLCANTGFDLHLIHPLGFEMDEKKLRRAGLDYRDLTTVKEHQNLAAFMQTVQPERVFACTTKGSRFYNELEYQAGDALMFGPETRGLSDEILASVADENRLRIPMQADSRSLNLSNAVSVIAYEAWRQQGFNGAV